MTIYQRVLVLHYHTFQCAMSCLIIWTVNANFKLIWHIWYVVLNQLWFFWDWKKIINTIFCASRNFRVWWTRKFQELDHVTLQWIFAKCSILFVLHFAKQNYKIYFQLNFTAFYIVGIENASFISQLRS